MNGPIVRWLETSRGSGVILILLLLGFWQFSALYLMHTPTSPPVFARYSPHSSNSSVGNGPEPTRVV